jgi:hypothetical protein
MRAQLSRAWAFAKGPNKIAPHLRHFVRWPPRLGSTKYLAEHLRHFSLSGWSDIRCCTRFNETAIPDRGNPFRDDQFSVHDNPGSAPKALRYMIESSSNAAVSAGTESARPFLPAKNFDLSKRLYEALGFTKVLEGQVAIFGIGAGSFILQNHFQPQWAENFMMQLMVDDLDAWWAHIVSLDLPTRFGVPAPKPPALQPWGLRIVYVIDPSGVFWHIGQRRPDTAHDK